MLSQVFVGTCIVSVLYCEPLFPLKGRRKWDAAHRTIQFGPARFGTEDLSICTGDRQLIIFDLDHDASIRKLGGDSLKAYDLLANFRLAIGSVILGDFTRNEGNGLHY